MRTVNRRAGDAVVVQLAAWFVQRKVLAAACLLALSLISAVLVVSVAHSNRSLYAELQRLHNEQDRLDSDYEKLLLEQSAWTDYSRIEEIAASRLAMKNLSPETIVAMKEPDSQFQR